MWRYSVVTTKSQWFSAIILSTGLLAGCGAAQPALDWTRLNLELSIHANHGQLMAHMMQFNGSVMTSNPLPLKEALQNPTTYFGTLLGPAESWTLVFGAEPKKPAERIFVNGHRAVQQPTRSTIAPGYIVWHYFLPGDVSHPVVKIK